MPENNSTLYIDAYDMSSGGHDLRHHLNSGLLNYVRDFYAIAQVHITCCILHGGTSTGAGEMRYLESG